MSRIRFLFLLPLCYCSWLSRAQSDTLFFNHAADSVVMEEFTPELEMRFAHDNGSSMTPILKRVVISEEEAAWLIKALNSKKSFGTRPAACFDPHLRFIFYRDNRVTGDITICVSCNRLVSSQRIPAQQQDEITTDRGEAYYLGQGMSKKFLSALDDLLGQYDFTYRVSEE